MRRLILALAILLALQGCGGGSGSPDEILARGFVAVDLDQDGDTDIAGLASNIDTDRGDHQLVLLLNSDASPGKFVRSRRVSVPGAIVGGAFSLAAGDLNQDGRVDIVVQNGGSLFLLLQSAAQAGSFGSPVKIEGGIRSYALAVADLNQDGFDDIALYGESASLSFLFQDSINPGHFLARVNTGISAQRLVVGDLDGDMIDDLAIIDGNRVRLLRQDPGAPGNFTSLLQVNVGEKPEEIAIADLDQDGRLDLVVENFETRGVVHGGGIVVLLQDAMNPGSFAPAETYGALCLPNALTVADLNHDGLADIAISALDKFCGRKNIDHAEKILLLFAQDPANPGRFSAPSRLPNRDRSVGQMRALDANVDGYNDLLVNGGGRIEALLQQPASPGSFNRRQLVYDPDR